MSTADAASEIPLLNDVQKKAAALGGQINDLTGPQLSKVSAQMRDRPLATVLVALGIGVIGGYLLKR